MSGPRSTALSLGGSGMLATTAPTMFEGRTATSIAYAATADSPVADAISLQRKTSSGIDSLDVSYARTAQPLPALTRASTESSTIL